MQTVAEPLLLSTKLKIPAPRKNYVARRALFQKLEQCGDMSVVFVNGGAGTGKTMLLSTFLHGRAFPYPAHKIGNIGKRGGKCYAG